MAIPKKSIRIENLTKKINIELTDTSYVPFINNNIKLHYLVTVNNPVLFVDFVLKSNKLTREELENMNDENILSVMKNSITNDLTDEGIHAKSLGLQATYEGGQ